MFCVACCNGPGADVNVSGFASVAAYSASKGDLGALTRSLVREVGRSGFAANSMVPGYMKTEVDGDWGKAQVNGLVRRTALRIMGDIEDVSGVVVFFLSEEASFFTGQRLGINGGMTC